MVGVKLRFATINDYSEFKEMDEISWNDWILGREDPCNPRPKKSSSNYKLEFSEEDIQRMIEEAQITLTKFDKLVKAERAFILEKDGENIGFVILGDCYKGYCRIYCWLLTEEDKNISIRRECLRQLAFMAPKRCRGFSICTFDHGIELKQLGFRNECFSFYYIDIADIKKAS